MLQVEQISGGYGATPIIKNVSFTVSKGKILGILGPNGSGKSTLLKVISGVLPTISGQILLDGKGIDAYSTKELAKKMAVLPQLHANAFSNSVRDAVSLGRYPHQSSFFASWSEQDEQAVQTAMRQTGVQQYEHAYLEYLSGGEQQRTFIAQALAQCANLLLLDEPTNHLDIAHQQQILDMIRKQALECELTVVSVFHDMNLAALYCDELLLMDKGQVKAFGKPHEVLLEAQIAEVYGARVTTYAHPELPKPQVTQLPRLKQENVFAPVMKEHFAITDSYVHFQAEAPLKVVSSAVYNAGMGWYTTFINRTVETTYHTENMKDEVESFLRAHDLVLTNTVVMLTALAAKNAVIESYADGLVLIAVTAGIDNAVDVTRAYEQEEQPHIGTINTWVIINGKLSDEAFYQAMITATEAKTRALAEQNIQDARTGTIATGTSTDSLLIAATQSGEELPYAGPITKVGKWIGRGVFDATSKAIAKYKKEG
ncbi:adenosylcobinamide amidohydrolase [Metasolibacillus fluoroglycofenilyticus]|uniref:adenosylcobinamide amidohydrolase n=1 Tax=Metasolibacillus fluoroglycofenilyticus TaxID=1239396 RepID=UPI000D341CE8|nr:adenosylcobinamide amidohydrolase [Metasolibacillus fluoroglycofenilyticus]